MQRAENLVYGPTAGLLPGFRWNLPWWLYCLRNRFRYWVRSSR
jgi:hypothetical protein